MKTKLRSLLLAATALLGASVLSAQVTLENFSAFQSSATFFYGGWSSSGDPFSGSLTPIDTFGQGAGFYNFAGGPNDAASAAERTFTSPLNLTGYDLLTVALRRLDGNTAASFTVTLFDASFNTAAVTFSTGDFVLGGTGFTTLSGALTAAGTFDFSHVTTLHFSGDDPFGGDTLSVAFDNLSATRSASTSPGLTAVPEPATYGALGAGALLVLCAVRRRK